jgi:hypothetical protein
MLDGFYALDIHNTYKRESVSAMLELVLRSGESGTPEFRRFKLHLVLYFYNQHNHGSCNLLDYEVGMQAEIQRIINSVAFKNYRKSALIVNALPFCEIQIHWQLSVAFAAKIKDEKWVQMITIAPFQSNAYKHGILAALREEERMYFVTNGFTDATMRNCAKNQRSVLQQNIGDGSRKYNRNEKQMQALVDHYFADLAIRMSPGLRYQLCIQKLYPDDEPILDPGIGSNYPGIFMLKHIRTHDPRFKQKEYIIQMSPAPSTNDVDGIVPPKKNTPHNTSAVPAVKPPSILSAYPQFSCMTLTGVMVILVGGATWYLFRTRKTAKPSTTQISATPTNPFDISLQQDPRFNFKRHGEYKKYRSELIRTLKLHSSHIKGEHLAKVVEKGIIFTNFTIGNSTDQMTNAQRQCQEELMKLLTHAKRLEPQLKEQRQ